MKNVKLLGILILLLAMHQLGAQNVVARYDFSGNAQDDNGTGYDGVVHGATLTTDRFGNVDSAYQFDGIDDYIEIPHWVPFNFGSDDFAVSVWVKTTNTTTTGMIFQKGSTSAYQAPQFWIRTPDAWLNNDLAFLTSNANPPSPYAATDTINIADGNWHHVVAQRSEKLLELYFDCHLVAVNEDAYRDVSDTIGVIIGAQHPHPGNPSINNFFSGSIDDITIYNDALTYLQIQNLCNSSTPISSIEKDKNSIRAFPNPFHDVVTIEGEFEYVEIYNLLGDKLDSYRNQNTIDLSVLVSGVYFCKVFNGDQVGCLKIIKK